MKTKKITKSKFITPDDSIFKDRDKEAQFWENNIDEVWKRAKPIKMQFSKNLKSVYLSDSINMRLDPQTSYQIREEAKKKGLGPTQLIRMWVMEKLAEQKIKPVV